MAAHDAFHCSVIVGKKQFAQRDGTEQMPISVEHIDDIHGFAFSGCGAYGFQSGGNAYFRKYGKVFGGGGGAGAFFREGGKLEKIFPYFGRKQGKQPLLRVCVEQNIEVCAFVRRQMLEHSCRSVGVHGKKEFFLLIFGKVAEYVCCRFSIQSGQQGERFFAGK